MITSLTSLMLESTASGGRCACHLRGCTDLGHRGQYQEPRDHVRGVPAPRWIGAGVFGVVRHGQEQDSRAENSRRRGGPGRTDRLAARAWGDVQRHRFGVDEQRRNPVGRAAHVRRQVVHAGQPSSHRHRQVRWPLETPGGPYPIPELAALVGGILATLFLLPRLGQPLVTGTVGRCHRDCDRGGRNAHWRIRRSSSAPGCTASSALHHPGRTQHRR